MLFIGRSEDPTNVRFTQGNLIEAGVDGVGINGVEVNKLGVNGVQLGELRQLQD